MTDTELLAQVIATLVVIEMTAKGAGAPATDAQRLDTIAQRAAEMRQTIRDEHERRAAAATAEG